MMLLLMNKFNQELCQLAVFSSIAVMSFVTFLLCFNSLSDFVDFAVPVSLFGSTADHRVCFLHELLFKLS